MYKKLTKRRIREKRKTNRGTLCANQSNKQSPRHLPQVSHHPPGRPLCYSCPAFFVDVKDDPPTNTTRLSLISSRYAAEVEIYGPFFCYPEHKSCIRIKVISLSSLSIIFFPTPDSTDICRKISQTDNNNNNNNSISPTRPQAYDDTLTIPLMFSRRNLILSSPRRRWLNKVQHRTHTL